MKPLGHVLLLLRAVISTALPIHQQSIRSGQPTAAVAIDEFPRPPSFLLSAVIEQYDGEWERLVGIGDAAMNKQNYANAENAYKKSLEFAQTHWSKDARIAGSLFKLAESYNAQLLGTDANTLAHRAVTSMEEAVKAHKPRDATEELRQVEVSSAFIDKVGDFFAHNQSFLDAEDMYRKVIRIREKYASEDFPEKPGNEDFVRFMSQTLSGANAKVADANDKLAALLRNQHRFHEAEALYKNSEAVREKTFGPDSVEVAQSLTGLATCYSQETEYEKAEPLYKRVIAILERSEYKEGTPMITALQNYALLLRKTGRASQAKPLLDRAASLRNKSSAPH